MARKVPFNNHYVFAETIDKIEKIILLFSAGFSIIVLLIDIFDKKLVYKDISQNLNIFVTIGSLAIVIVELLHNFFFQQAEFNRKRDFIDNSLNSSLADENSEEYFNNDEVSPGVYKLGVNCFESAMHTRNTLKHMLRQSLVVNVLLVTLFVCLMFFSEHRVFSSILQIALPISIVIQNTKLFILNHQVNQVYDRFKIIMPSGALNQEAEIISNVLRYEKALSWACIQPSSRIFNKHNDKVSADWVNIIKQRYVR